MKMTTWFLLIVLLSFSSSWAYKAKTFSIEDPKDWQIQPKLFGTEVLYTPSYYEAGRETTFMIFLQARKIQGGEKTIVSQVTQDLGASPGFQLIRSGRWDNSKLKFPFAEYTYFLEGKKVRTLSMMDSRKNLTHFFQFTAPASRWNLYYPAVKKAMASFRLR